MRHDFRDMVYIIRRDAEDERRLGRPQMLNIKMVDYDTFCRLGENHFTYGRYVILNVYYDLEFAISKFRELGDFYASSRLVGNKNVQSAESIVARALHSNDWVNNQVLVDIADICEEDELVQAVDNINKLIYTDLKVMKSTDYPAGYWIYLEE